MEKTLSAGNPLGTEKISKLLFRYSFPSIIAMLVSSLYNIVDQMFYRPGSWLSGQRRDDGRLSAFRPSVWQSPCF